MTTVISKRLKSYVLHNFRKSSRLLIRLVVWLSPECWAVSSSVSPSPPPLPSLLSPVIWSSLLSTVCKQDCCPLRSRCWWPYEALTCSLCSLFAIDLIFVMQSNGSFTSCGYWTNFTYKIDDAENNNCTASNCWKVLSLLDFLSEAWIQPVPASLRPDPEFDTKTWSSMFFVLHVSTCC